jgi:hypothetical protein
LNADSKIEEERKKKPERSTDAPAKEVFRWQITRVAEMGT